MPIQGNVDQTYPSKLLNIGVRICGEFKGAKLQHTLECLNCKHTWEATPISKMQTYKKWNVNGCPACHTARENSRKILSRGKNINKVKNRGLEILSEWNGQIVTGTPNESIPVQVDLRNIKCGHTFTTDSKNLITRNVTCPICAQQLKTKNLNDSSKQRSDHWALSAPEWKRYRSEVTKLTKIAYTKHKDAINPNNLPTGRAGTEGAYHLDHIVPVRYCFDNNIPVTVCAHWSNLQMLGWRDNVGSRDKLKEGVNVPEIFHPFIR